MEVNSPEVPVAAASPDPSTPPPPPDQIAKDDKKAPMAPRPKPDLKTIALALLVVFAGIASGYGLSALRAPSASSNLDPAQPPTDKTAVEIDTLYGSQMEVFADVATGVVIKGGVEGEGSHRLLRPGGDTQTICLTSTVVDLDLFIDHEIEIWGETFDVQKCPWFMDVGRVKVTSLNPPKPFDVEE